MWADVSIVLSQFTCTLNVLLSVYFMREQGYCSVDYQVELRIHLHPNDQRASKHIQHNDKRASTHKRLTLNTSLH